MMFRVPDWLRYEIRHKIEGLRNTYERLQLRDKINEHPKTAAAIGMISLLLLISVASRAMRTEPGHQPRESKNAWYYDLNTGKLFVASSKHTGPIVAPSGPLPDGERAGYRAHVYSYLRDPNESERFVAFLEKPDPNVDPKTLSRDRNDFEAWARGRLIRRVGGDRWVSPTSQRGQQIIQELTHPNVYGQTPVYQEPR